MVIRINCADGTEDFIDQIYRVFVVGKEIRYGSGRVLLEPKVRVRVYDAGQCIGSWGG